MQRSKMATVVSIGSVILFITGSVPVRADDCNSNGIPDDQDIAVGTSEDCNTNGVPDECETGIVGAGFDDAASWETFDAGSHGVGKDADGYYGAVFDGRYVYFSPSHNGSEFHGEVLRYDTLAEFGDPGGWRAFDAGSHGVGTDPDGYDYPVFDGRYVYFTPLQNRPDAGAHGEVLRYDSQGPFDGVSSWKSFDPGSHGVGDDPRGYVGSAFDGQYVYFAPARDLGDRAEVLRYDTVSDFLEPASWKVVDVIALVGAKGGYRGAVFADGYVYFVPYLANSQHHGEVLRYDTQSDFEDAGAWTVYEYADHCDPPQCNAPEGYHGAVCDERYVYFVPNWGNSGKHGEALRYDTLGAFDTASSWVSFDPGDCQPPVAQHPDGFTGAIFDGRFVYFVPQSYAVPASSAHGEVLRYDTMSDFASCESWTAFDAGSHGVGRDPDGFFGGAFDGQFIYFAPYYDGAESHGEVLRYDIQAGWSPDCNSNGIPDECEPDLDGDGIVNPQDICPCTISPGGVTQDGRPLGDLDEDCDVDLQDYAIFAVNHQAGGPRS